MITSHQQQFLHRDLDQLEQWTSKLYSDYPKELLQDLMVDGNFNDILNAISFLRTKIENQTEASK